MNEKNDRWLSYSLYNHIKHFWKNDIVDRLNRHGVHFITFSDERIRRYAGQDIISKKETNDEIARLLLSDEPCMIGRLGGSEVNYITHYIKDKERGSRKGKEEALKRVCFTAGFFPEDEEQGDRMARMYLDDIAMLDVCGIWRFFMEDYLLYNYSDNCRLSILEWLEPWRAQSRPWTYALKGKRVLVVHPFEDTIRNQYEYKRTEIFAASPYAEDLLPEFELITLKTVQSMGGEGAEGYSNWFEALDHMKAQIDSIDYDIAIIGAGAYGMPLAAYVKRSGKKAVHLGGATQLMFGIRGKRWDKVPEIAALMNDSWVSASKKETPELGKKVENGCYW